MKTSIYFNYTTRSLLRGGQRTVLAFFCVGVGGMVIVALQLVGLMIENALAANVRAASGGDIKVSAGLGARPFTQNDLNYFSQLKSNGTITNYTALENLENDASFSSTFNVSNSFSMLVVNQGTFPIGLIAGSALLAVLTALLVAWGSVRVRPLEVLRYE